MLIEKGAPMLGDHDPNILIYQHIEDLRREGDKYRLVRQAKAPSEKNQQIAKGILRWAMLWQLVFRMINH